MKPASPLKDAIDKVVAKMTGIMSRKEIVEAVLKHYASKAKDPASSIMNDLRWRKEGQGYVLGEAARMKRVFADDGVNLLPARAHRQDDAAVARYFPARDQEIAGRVVLLQEDDVRGHVGVNFREAGRVVELDDEHDR